MHDDEDALTFTEFALPPTITSAIGDLGFTHCTPIQGAVLPYSLSDYDITGQAQTGTGKTAAFLITILAQQIEFSPGEPRPTGAPRALVLAPTRELALQIEADARDLSRHTSTHVVAVVGGMDFDRQQKQLENRPVDILVATPGRLIDFCNRRVISLRKVEILVIDEADRMLDMGFIPDVRRIVYQTPKKRDRQTLFFSATFNDDVMNLADQWTIDPMHVVIQPEQVAVETVDQRFWHTAKADKPGTLVEFIRQKKPSHTLVFVNRRDQARHLVSHLNRQGIDCEGLAGDIPQRKRLATLNRFKEGTTNLVVATDVAGRGIHVEGISHVINYDLPEDAEDYVHRIGRTGRAGASGISISFVSEDDAFNLPAIEAFIGTGIVCTHPDL
ncbi:MAG: DEAD/DEAH box helicase [Pseudomonadota bacterium]|uniref:ATP-dependent RNA helicase RhlB n=1 Tax=marine metagenome TaxID=408172 RepID=A0A381NV38_9ZZZZ|nr:ATP-dependent RNA helicase RhlB [Gammaproteobacteria bacterium]MEC8868234.1 DEAD/DEAH box helicase [Pseudomonadota bacterium]MEC9285041.1 DEAD/DEAH box helicase [Pseudomonadota bacterium]MEE3183350.1 DEAD/DEAH box helicase [Pseudomonadota bacterium]HBP14126.1 ATP-dependent RNA helicase RhlB [Gammaproteobacteria bacterium]|tara:strand:- start:5679 stop:6839 length:1161 start_codon:yes stop_codon:yes gene_type:complete